MTRPKEYYKATTDKLTNPCSYYADISEEQILEYPNEIQLLIYEAQNSDQTIQGDYNQDRLEELISEIKGNQYNWVKSAIHCWKLKTWRLYKDYAKTWEEFCNKILGISHWMVNSWIRAAGVIGRLIKMGFKILPKCENQTRPLAKLEDSELFHQWQNMTETTPEHKISRSAIEIQLGIDTEEKATLRIKAKLKNKLKAKAENMGITLEELLEILAADEEPTPEPLIENGDKCNQNYNNTTLREKQNNQTESFKESAPAPTQSKLKSSLSKKSKKSQEKISTNASQTKATAPMSS